MNTSMRALVAEAGEVALLTVPRPRLRHDDEVLIRVAAAGICRTDAYVALGQIPTQRAVILGHELSGVVVACGAAVLGLAPGDRVTADPVLPCGRCAGCGDGATCFGPTTLGIDSHGCFAEFLVLPARMLHVVPDGMSPFEAAYVEPVAACLAILDAGISPGDRGIVAGSNRFARLARAVLAQRGFDCAREPAEPGECSLDFAIETGLDTETLAGLVRALRPGGTLVLKSRSPMPLPLPARDLVRKELRVQAVSYGSFAEAISLIATGALRLPPQHIHTAALEDYPRALLGSSRDELGKAFFVLSATSDWPSCVA